MPSSSSPPRQLTIPSILYQWASVYAPHSHRHKRNDFGRVGLHFSLFCLLCVSVCVCECLSVKLIALHHHPKMISRAQYIQPYFLHCVCMLMLLLQLLLVFFFKKVRHNVNRADKINEKQKTNERRKTVWIFCLAFGRIL